ncbi:hypothetical protein QYE76_001394 [Lolium multiflorum]|uniref:Uncharacterized protein n=1 Tax=Lolium multiflorum TaxID=4521 RepID=A0AAD8VYJ3_LOLMU|nr:hypothetical protein QYE76_001394 [Lolium multiflorum]
MSITLGAATKLLDDMMINYSEWHTERTPQGKKVNSVEETSSLGDKIDAIMSMLANGRSHIDPNNVPLASLVAQEENVDVNFIKNNNFNNNAYRNNYGNNNYRPYPSNNGNGYGNSYGNSYNNNKSVPSGLEVMLKEFISTQTAFNKTVEEKLGKIDVLASKVDSLALDVDLLKLKVMPEKVEDARFAKTNAIQVRINDNIRLLAELHARWDREEKEKLAKENNIAKVWTITTTSNVDSSHVAAPPTINGKIIGVGNVSTPSTKRTKLPETAVCDKTAEIFRNIGDNDSIAVENNGLDFDDCHITEVIKFLQKLARSPNSSAINLAFTKHITNALIKAREDKLKLEASIPRKLEDGWEPIIKMKFNDFECNSLCDLGASISVMPKKIYDITTRDGGFVDENPGDKNAYRQGCVLIGDEFIFRQAFKAMDRSWITDGTKKFTTKYMAGVRDFIKFAQEHLDNTDEPILCPCKDCLNLIRQDIKTVEDHCNCSGMSMTYTRWTRHGEDFSDDEGRDRDDDGAYDSDNDEEEDNGDCYVDDSSSMIDELQKSGNKGPDLPNMYANLIESAKKELHKGCTTFTRLSFIIKLLHVKSYSRITNRGFDLLLQLLRTALPDVDFPKSYADAKSVLSDVGLSYETIHACKFDCSLFWGDHKDDTHCHVCGVSRYRDPTGKKKIPHKVLRYFPIIKRLQRLFVKKEMSTHTRWHKEKRVVEPNVLRHPADGEAWKHFDGKFDWFAKDPRNIRLGFATDGFSPFGSMSNPYSMWPVFVIPYNFPPWMCMDQSNYMMALLIPGKYSPGKDFHVFMQPLIKDMMQLWSGVQTFDACTEEYFPLHAAFLWSIHDYPGYATMSGRSTRGFHACVHCDENPCAESLKNKIGYIGHRRFLDKSHPYRRSRLFNGKAETRDPPRKYTTKEVAAKVESVKDFEHGKNPISRKRKRATVPGEPTWHLKVSLHHLPYWPELKIAHNLDVMHIEKNICDNIVGTLLELEGRNKDTVSARIDLKKFKMWEKYWLKKIVKDDGDAAVTYAKPPAPWTLSKEQKRHLCRYLANTRFPDGYCANWGRCVNIDGCKVTGMKTHDCHILLQRVLPAGLKGIASKEMYVAIAELGRFFRELCAKTLKVDVLNRLKVEIVVILCKLEKLFPPAFFDVMVHLAIHLPEEALLRGPVHYGWMYPVERRLGYLKSTVRNKARPEGSIAEGYIVDECLIFCSRFFKDGTETRFNRDDRNQDIRRKPDRDEMEVFSVGAKGLGKSILNHFDKEFDKMVWYVLNNCDDVERYINEFRQELGGRGVRDTEETVQREFAGWFANHVRQLDNASEDLKSLAAGPDRRVVVYAGCNVKGARFRTLTRDKDLKTQNSGVATKGSFGDADETEYYGVLQEVLELQYGSNKHGDRSVYLFRCDWFDLASRGSKIKDDGYFKSVNTSVLWFKNSPFILASQAETCFYLEDTKFGDPWKVVQKFSHRHVYDVPELEDGNDDAFVRNEDAYQEDEGSVDHTFHDVVDLDEEAEVEAEEDDHRADEVVRIHDARTIRELENGEDSPNVDMDMSEDELQNEEESLIMEENIHDDEGKNSEEDSDVD